MAFEVVLLTDLAPHSLWARPVGAYRLATELRREGYRTKVIFGLGDYTPAEQRDLLSKYISPSTRVLGLATTFMSHDERFAGPRGWRNTHFADVLESLRDVRAKYPGLHFVSGGANAHRWPSDMIDLYVAGFGDRVIVDFLSGRMNLGAIRTEQGRKVLTIAPEILTDDFQTLYDESDGIFPEETLTLEISRGCRFRCKFCAYPLNGRAKNDYLKSASALSDEIKRNYEMFGVSNYILGDDTFNESAEKLEHVLSVFERSGVPLQWATYMRLDLLSQQKQYWERLVQTGLRGAFFGIESLHDPAARSIGKGIGFDRVVKTLTELKSTWGDDVATQGGFIVGLPHETEATFVFWKQILFEKSFPLHVKTFQPLWIDAANPFYPWRSEFQTGASDYGYVLSGSGSNSSWSNQHWNSLRATELANEANRQAVEVGALKSFGPFFNMMIMGNGLSYRDAFAIDPTYAGYDKIAPLVKKRVAEYLAKELKFESKQKVELCS